MAVEKALKSEQVKTMDPIWDAIRTEALQAAENDPVLATYHYSTILNFRTLEDAVIHRVCERLDHPDMPTNLLRQTYDEMLSDWPQWSSVLRVDIQAVYDRDPACHRFIEPVLYFKGFHAIQAHRLAHWLWEQGRTDYALYLQSRSSEVFQVDIHPGVRMGKGYSSTTRPESSSAVRPSSRTMCRSSRASPSAAPERKRATAIRKSGTAC